MSFQFNKYIGLLNDKKLEEALEYRKSHMPKKIYKYVSLTDKKICSKDEKNCSNDEGLNNLKFETLRGDKIWMSKFNNLNDPFEYKSMFLKREELTDKGWPIDMLEGYLNSMKESFLISSFTTNLVDNMPMWAHYSNNHKGFCVEYTVLNPKLVYPISYEENRFGIGSILTSIFNLCYKIQSGEIDEKNKDFQFYLTLITHFGLLKHKTWEYENEYRILYPGKVESKAGALISTIDVGLVVTGIYVGNQCTIENKAMLTEIAKSHGIKIYEMYLDDEQPYYKLSNRLIDKKQ